VPNAWLVMQSKGSKYGDVEGKRYHYPMRIPNGRRIREGDVLVCYQSSKDAQDGRRVFGLGQVRRLEPDGETHRWAVYGRYLPLSEPATFGDIGGDPRNNKTNAITTAPYEVVERLLQREGLTTIEDVPVVEAGDELETARSLREHPSSDDHQERAFEWVREGARLAQAIKERGFVFEPWQVAAYVTALRTKPFVILAGITGTGKSQLPSLVATATGGESRLVAVRPDWTDSSDVLGYSDLRETFRPGLLLELAREATNHPARHFVCIVDEMNIARVEHYFAEVLSRLEDRRPVEGGGFGSGPLLSQGLPAGQAGWARQGLPPNLAIVGTVNMDESAHGFSRKVLDRAFTLELSDIDLTFWEQETHEPIAPIRWPVTAWYPRAIRLGGFAGLTEDERASIGSVIDVLTNVNASLKHAQLQVGYRTRDEVALFVLHAQDLAPLFVTRTGDQVAPLDLALQMKVLPRLVGGSGAVRHTILRLLGWASGGKILRDEDEADAILQTWETQGRGMALTGADYPRTAARLCLMWERLVSEGFTSFWL
jgi:hypothetical protein